MPALSSTPATDQEDPVTDTFEFLANNGSGKLSMQFMPSTTPSALGMDPISGDTALIQCPTLHLPEPPRLVHLLQIFWSQHNPFFPCMDRCHFQEGLFQWLPAAGYRPGNTAVRVTSAFTPLASNLCMVLAVAEFVDPQRGSVISDLPIDQCIPGKLWHDKSLAILEGFFPVRDQEIELVRFHVLEAMYLLNTEQLREASKVIAVAVQLAIRAQLHDQSSWTGLSPAMADSRRILYWCLYYLDRLISEKSGQPYLLRNDEVYMTEMVTSTISGALPPINGHSESLAFNVTMSHYVQHLIDWAHLWTDIWDTLFSIRARRLVGDVSYHVQSANRRIERMLANLPPTLQWRPERLKTSSGSDVEDERQARLPLLAFTVSVGARCSRLH